MSRQPDRPRPIERFLGSSEAIGGPFALLGVSAPECSDETVLAGLDRQLERIAHHPECDTPEADEVRLALHAAAAQLLDPAVRRHLVAKWTGAPAPPRTAPPAQPPASPHAQRMLEHDAILSLGLHGGWNEGSLRRLAALAHARGLGPDQVATALRSLATRRKRARAAPPRPRASAGPAPAMSPPPSTAETARRPAPSPPPADEPLPEQQDPAGRFLWMLALFAGGGLLLAAGAIFLIIRFVVTPPASPAPAPAPVAGAPEPATPVEPTPAPPEAHTPTVAPVTQGRPPGSIRRELEEHTRYLSQDPAAAVEQFGASVRRLSREWYKLSRDELIACGDAVVEFVYRAGVSPDAGPGAVAIVGAGAEALSRADVGSDPDAVLPAVWSTGMLSRLSHEKDLSAAVKTELDRRLATAAGPAGVVQERTFEGGARLALGLLPNLMLPRTPAAGELPVNPVAAWSAWAEGVKVTTGDERASNELFLVGLETLLVSGPEPVADRRTYELIVALTARLPWRDGDASRVRLLRWFSDPRITVGDLHTVTTTLAMRSAAEGVDLTMVLPSTASDRVRGDLRERFARLWGIDAGVDRALLDSSWADAARLAVDRAYAARAGAGHLAAAVVLARVNEAAWRRWRGDADEAARLLVMLSGDVDRLVPPTGVPPIQPVTPIPNVGDVGWAEKYLAARRAVPQRLELLNRLGAQVGVIGPVDAEVLAQEALLGTPAEVRVRAAEVARVFASSPAMINAVLEYLPRAPRIAHTSDLVQFIGAARLPPVHDAAWPAAARRALVEAYLERFTAEGSSGSLDSLSRMLAVAYRGMASETPLTDAMSRDPLQPATADSAAAVRARWRADADRLPPSPTVGATLADLDRRHAGRLGLARGLVQAFAAQQVGTAELMAYVIAAERPDSAEQVGHIMTEMSRVRGGAGTILEQLGAVERAMTQLWLLRAAPAVPKESEAS